MKCCDKIPSDKIPLNSRNKELYYDANIMFRILVKLIHTVAGHIGDQEQRCNG